MVQSADRKGVAQEAASPPTVRVPSLPECVAGLQAWLKAAGYDAVMSPTFTWVNPDGRPGVLPLNFMPSPPMATAVSAVSALGSECRELADAIAGVLETAGPGVVMAGIDIATRISDDTDHTGGTWGRAIKALKADGVIASAGKGSAGYCLTSGG